MDKSFRKITKESLDAVKINIPIGENKILEEVLKRINSSNEIKMLWKIMNIMAIDRLSMSDHGPTHFQIVASNGIKILKLLEKNNIEMSVVRDFGLTNDHAEVIVFLGCYA